MTDLTQLSDADLHALAAGNLTQVSDAGLAHLSGTQSSAPSAAGSGIIGQIGDAASAFGHHLMNLPHGIAQLVENGVNAGAQLLPDNPASRYINQVTQADNAAMAKRESDYQANTPTNAGSIIGATAGEVLPFAANSVAAPIRAAGDLIGNFTAKELPSALADLGGKMASGATQGAIVAAAQPVTNSDYWQGKGDQAKSGLEFGAALPLVAKGVQGVYSGLKDALQPLVNPMGAAANRFASTTGIDPQALAAALKNPTEYVKGSTPTTAQVIATPEAVQLEKAMRNNPAFASKMESITNANNAARLDQINQVAGQPGDLEGYVAQRAQNAKGAYDQAFSEYDPANVTPWVKGQITQLMKRPAMQTAMNDAQAMAKNEGLSLTDANSVQGLHYAKMSLDDQISRAMRTGDNNAARALTQTKEELLTVMGKLSPSYQEAMKGYAADSVPVNTMEVGRAMQDALWNRPMNTAGDPSIQYQQYRTALAKALNGSEYGIHPDAEAALQNVQNDLQRQTISNGLRFPGSDTNYNGQAQGWLSRQLYGNDFSGSGALTKGIGAGVGGVIGGAVGHPWAGAGVGASAALGLSKLAASRVNNAMSEFMTSPQVASEALSKVDQRKLNLMAEMLRANPMTQQFIQSARSSP